MRRSILILAAALVLSSPFHNSFAYLSTINETDSSDGNVINKSFVSENGERFLRLELVVDASIEEVWEAFTTEEGIKTWMTPVVKLDFRIGGSALTNYNKDAKPGDEGTITLGIINYIPYEMLTYKVTLTSVFPEKCRNEDENLQEIIQFKPVKKNKTKIISTMVGWGEGKDWDQTYSFFEKGNKWSYEELLKRFTTGPIEWK
jgi:uncharacterized protein YndB with AHSA1/START domain